MGKSHTSEAYSCWASQENPSFPQNHVVRYICHISKLFCIIQTQSKLLSIATLGSSFISSCERYFHFPNVPCFICYVLPSYPYRITILFNNSFWSYHDNIWWEYKLLSFSIPNFTHSTIAAIYIYTPLPFVLTSGKQVLQECAIEQECWGWRRETGTFEIIRKKNEGNLQNFIWSWKCVLQEWKFH
jgi:hypothetical protein